jgi:hypothetical protein
MDEEIMVCTYNGIFFCPEKKEVMLPVATWIDMENIIPHQISLSLKDNTA